MLQMYLAINGAIFLRNGLAPGPHAKEVLKTVIPGLSYVSLPQFGKAYQDHLSLSSVCSLVGSQILRTEIRFISRNYSLSVCLCL